MTYSIYNTSSSATYTITDGTVNIDLDIGLVGKGYLGYGPTINRNFLQILENFSNASAPSKPVKGQLWYDSLNSVVKVYNGTAWSSVGGSSLNATSATLSGDLTVSGTATFYGTVNLPTLSSLTVSGALTAGSVTATSHYGSLNGPFNGTVGATTPNTGAFTSVTTGTMGVSAALTAGSLNGPFNGTVGATTPNTGAFTSVTTGTMGVSTALTVNTGNNLTAIVNGGTNGTGNIGSSGSSFNTVFAKATTAQYADLAENYVADDLYEAGTVLDFGGEFDVTISSKSNSSRVAGVVSTNPAYLMNGDEEGVNVVAVALTGRVPCKCIGPVEKGDIVVSAGNGYAVVNNTPNTGTIIGKAIQKMGVGEGVIDIVVGRF